MKRTSEISAKEIVRLDPHLFRFEQDPVTKKYHLFFVDRFDPEHLYLHRVKRVLARWKSKFQLIHILKLEKYGVVLILDGFPQINTRYDCYTEALAVPALRFHPAPSTIRILGGGDGPLLRTVLQHDLVQQVIVVDIDPDVDRLCRKHMPSVWRDIPRHEKTNRARVIHADALKYVKDDLPSADIIFLDLTDPEESRVSNPLMTRSFFRDVANGLSGNGGLCAMQSGELNVHRYKGHLRARRLMQTAFKHVVSYAIHVPWFTTTWGFILGSQEPLDVTNRSKRRFFSFPLNQQLQFLRDDASIEALFALSPAVKEKLKIK